MQPHDSIIVPVPVLKVAVLMPNDSVEHRDIVRIQRDNILRRISGLHSAYCGQIMVQSQLLRYQIMHLN